MKGKCNYMKEMNRTLELIQERSSIRRYKDTPLSEEEINTLKRVALATPTGQNLQELRYAFVTDQKIIKAVDERCFYHNPEMLERMKKRDADSIFYGAPLVVFVSAKDTSWADADAGIAVANLALAAQSMGLGSVILGFPRSAFKPDDPENCCALLGMEEGEHFRLSIAIGHPDTTKEPHEQDPSHIRDFLV
jgi:nitroreductase